MTKITNKHDLPSALVSAQKNDPYSRGDADISVTELLNPPRLRIMKQVYSGDDAPEVDVSTRIWPLLGKAFHELMDAETEPGTIKEERLFAGRYGWVLSGAIDRQIPRGNKVDIEDFKVTSVYTYLGAERGDKTEWEEQLNLYRALVEGNGKAVKNLYIVALLRDWRPMEAKTKTGYPKKPIVKLRVPKWPKSKCDAFIKKRMDLHQEAQVLFDQKGEIVHCTDEERWYSGDKWAAMKKGAQRATKLFDDELEAHAYVQRYGMILDHRPGENRRCEGYCDFAPMCGQFQKIKDDLVVNQVMDKMEETD